MYIYVVELLFAPHALSIFVPHKQKNLWTSNFIFMLLLSVSSLHLFRISLISFKYIYIHVSTYNLVFLYTYHLCRCPICHHFVTRQEKMRKNLLRSIRSLIDKLASGRSTQMLRNILIRDGVSSQTHVHRLCDNL